jgi:hypothetical protein
MTILTVVRNFDIQVTVTLTPWNLLCHVFAFLGDQDSSPTDPVDPDPIYFDSDAGIFVLLQNVLISTGRLRSPFGRSLGQPVRLYGGQSERKALGTALIPPPHRQSISERKASVAR